MPPANGSLCRQHLSVAADQLCRGLGMTTGQANAQPQPAGTAGGSAGAEGGQEGSGSGAGGVGEGGGGRAPIMSPHGGNSSSCSSSGELTREQWLLLARVRAGKLLSGLTGDETDESLVKLLRVGGHPWVWQAGLTRRQLVQARLKHLLLSPHGALAPADPGGSITQSHADPRAQTTRNVMWATHIPSGAKCSIVCCS